MLEPSVFFAVSDSSRLSRAVTASYPRRGELQLAVTESRLLRAQRQVNDNPAPVIPAVNQPLPPQ